jgi:hypothetical protein
MRLSAPCLLRQDAGAGAPYLLVKLLVLVLLLRLVVFNLLLRLVSRVLYSLGTVLGALDACSNGVREGYLHSRAGWMSVDGPVRSNDMFLTLLDNLLRISLGLESV